MKTAIVAWLTVLAVLWGGAIGAGSQPTCAGRQTAKLPTIELNGADNGKHISAKAGQKIVVMLQTVGPGQYDEPKVSSAAVRFEGSYFTKMQIPAGPRQVYRFVAAAAGEATVEIPHSWQQPKFCITIKVAAD